MDLIIGAGITGLSYVNFCGHNDYLILEKENKPGGYCKTVNKDGFVWDFSGHFFHFRDNTIKDFLFERMDIKNVLTIIKQAQVKYKNKYIDFPFQKNIHQLSKKEFIDCLYDLFTKKEMDSYNSFKEMLYGKFGNSISEKFLIPYNEKLYACDLNDLDVNSMGRFFPYAEKEEIIRNFKEKSTDYYNRVFTYPKKGAMEYVYALLKGIDNKKLKLNECILSIDIRNKNVKTNKRTIHYDRLISTIPFPSLLQLCNIDYENTLYSWNKVLVFNLGFNKASVDRKNHWIYFPEKKYCFYRVGYYNNILVEDRMSLYIEIGFDSSKRIDIKKERERTINDLKLAGIIKDHKLTAFHSVIMDPAYVHVKEKSNEHKSLQKLQLKKKQLFSIGRYGDWKYCSIEDNIIEAKKLANELN